MNLGNVIKDLRTKKGIKQGVLAQELGVTQSYLSRIEKGEKQPSLDLINATAKTFGMPVYYIMLKALDPEKDIAPEKRDVYAQISPVIEGMIEKMLIA